MDEQRVKNILSTLDRLGCGHGKVDELLTDLDSLKSTLDEQRKALASLRPVQKDYRDNLVKLSGVSQAVESQVSHAGEALTQELRTILAGTIDNAGALTGPHRDKLEQLDRAALAKLSEVYTLLVERDAVSSELAERYALLDGLASEIRKPLGLSTDVGQPWFERWRGLPESASRFIARFARKCGFGGAPTQLDELWKWFVTD